MRGNVYHVQLRSRARLLEKEVSKTGGDEGNRKRGRARFYRLGEPDRALAVGRVAVEAACIGHHNP